MNHRWCLPLLVAALPGCSADAPPPAYQGYVEGEYVRVASPLSGTLKDLAVDQGATVPAGAPLFVLEQENEAAARRGAEERLAQAKAQLADLEKGRRPEEIAAIEAQRRQALAALKLAEADLERVGKLVASGFQSEATLDQARSARDRARAAVAEVDAQLRVARLAGRADQIKAARASVAAAQATLDQAVWQTERKTVAAPVAGVVQDRLYLPGEFVPAGTPVLSILPPGNIKLRFFVPETDLPRFKPGSQVKAGCDGCGADIAATVSFVSTQPEYTPPVIYNRDNRTKLVWLVEARPALQDAARLSPGQPVDVRLP
jgi:HlyD family secretion protein